MVNADIQRLSATDRPSLRLRSINSSITVEGSKRADFGHNTSVGGSDVDGDDPLAFWNWNDGQLVVKDDRFGLFPIYYRNSDSHFAISSSIAHVLGDGFPVAIDYEAMAVFLRLGHFLGEDTPFTGVRVLPPSGSMSWINGKLDLVQQSNVSCSGELVTDFDLAVEEYITLFEDALRRRLPECEEFTVPLSGGRDSRHLLFALHKLGYVPQRCPTVEFRPPSANEDLRIAKMICDRLGIEQVALSKPTDYFKATLKDIELTDHCGGGHPWVLPLAAYLKNRYSVVYDGLGGDVLSAGHTLSKEKILLSERQRFEDLAVLLLGESQSEGFINTVCTSEFRKRVPFDLAVSRMVKELARHTDSTSPLVSFIFWNRTRRGIAQIPFGIFQGIKRVFVPYLDSNLFNFFMRLDPAITLGNKLHDEVIRRGYPEFASIPFEEKRAAGGISGMDRAYYRKASQGFLRYLVDSFPRDSRVVRRGFLMGRSIVDAMKGGLEPWYMGKAARLMEIERVLQRVK